MLFQFAGWAFLLMPTASDQQYKSTIAFYCHSLPAQDCVCVSYRLVNLKTSFVICQKPSGHISCSSPPSVLQERRGIHLWLCGMAEDQPASPCEASAGAGDDVVGGLHVFPCVPLSMELWQQAAGSQGSSKAQGIVFASSGDCGTAWNQSSAHRSAFPLLLPYSPLAPHHIFTLSWVLGPSAPLGILDANLFSVP